MNQRSLLLLRHSTIPTGLQNPRSVLSRWTERFTSANDPYPMDRQRMPSDLRHRRLRHGYRQEQCSFRHSLLNAAIDRSRTLCCPFRC